jgi:hypothetical protein
MQLDLAGATSEAFTPMKPMNPDANSVGVEHVALCIVDRRMDRRPCAASASSPVLRRKANVRRHDRRRACTLCAAVKESASACGPKSNS